MKEKTGLFFSVFILHLAFRELFQFFQEARTPQLVISISFLALFIVFQLWKRPLAGFFISTGVLALLIIKLLNTFPTCSNHFYIEMLMGSFFLLFSTERYPDDERHSIFQRGILGLIIFVFIAAGLQKIIAGTYFNTAFLAFRIWDSEVFANNLKILIPGDVARITSGDGSQAFFLEQPLGIAMCYMVPVLEILGGALLIFRKTRIIGFYLCFGSLLAIEIIAREFLFGLLYLLCLGLVLETRSFRRWSYVIASSYALLVAIHFIFPKFFFN